MTGEGLPSLELKGGMEREGNGGLRRGHRAVRSGGDLARSGARGPRGGPLGKRRHKGPLAPLQQVRHQGHHGLGHLGVLPALLLPGLLPLPPPPSLAPPLLFLVTGRVAATAGAAAAGVALLCFLGLGALGGRLVLCSLVLLLAGLLRRALPLGEGGWRLRHGWLHGGRRRCHRCLARRQRRLIRCSILLWRVGRQVRVNPLALQALQQLSCVVLRRAGRDGTHGHHIAASAADPCRGPTVRPSGGKLTVEDHPHGVSALHPLHALPCGEEKRVDNFSSKQEPRGKRAHQIPA